MRGDLLILSTRSMSDYTARVAYHLETFPDFQSSAKPREIVDKLAVVKFADGEMEVEVRVSLRGKDVFLFAGAGRNPAGLGVEENKLELYHSIDALRRAQAGRITLFEPYCSCARSDRTTRRNSVGFWVHYKTVKELGVDHIITCQLHSDKSKTIVDPTCCAIDDIPINALLEEYIARKFIGSLSRLRDHVQSNWIFCSVDAGSEGLAKRYADDFGCHLMVAHKHRDDSKVNTVDAVSLLSDTAIESKEVWIVDDMIDTGGSVDVLIRELRKRKIAQINIVTAHLVLSGSALSRLKRLCADGLLQKIVAVDTVYCPENLLRELPCLHIVPSARHSAEVVMRIHNEESMSFMFDSFKVTDFLKRLEHHI